MAPNQMSTASQIDSRSRMLDHEPQRLQAMCVSLSPELELSASARRETTFSMPHTVRSAHHP